MLYDWICVDANGRIVGSGNTPHQARQSAASFGLSHTDTRELTSEEQADRLSLTVHPRVLNLAGTEGLTAMPDPTCPECRARGFDTGPNGCAVSGFVRLLRIGADVVEATARTDTIPGHIVTDETRPLMERHALWAIPLNDSPEMVRLHGPDPLTGGRIVGFIHDVFNLSPELIIPE